MSKALYDIAEESSDSNDSLLEPDQPNSSSSQDPTFLLAVIGDEDTCVGYLLGGIGEVDDEGRPNYFVVDRKTKDEEVEAAFNKFVNRSDIGIVLITKEAAKRIPKVLQAYGKTMPMVVQIPGKNGPFEVDIDYMLEEPERNGMISNELG